MLGLLHPMVPEEALELRIEIPIVSHAVHVMKLSHPFDVGCSQRHGQRVVGKHCLANGLGGPITVQECPKPAWKCSRKHLKR